MSQPVRPAYVPPVWAPSTNYPAGVAPWSGTPTKTPHPGQTSYGFTPRTGVGAQNFNDILSQLAACDDSALAAIQALYDYQTPIDDDLQSSNFPYQSSGIAHTPITATPIWDSVGSRWICGAGASVSSSGRDVYASYDGQSWVSLGAPSAGASSTNWISALSVDPSTGDIVAINMFCDGAAALGATNAHKFTASTRTWATTASPGSLNNGIWPFAGFYLGTNHIFICNDVAGIHSGSELVLWLDSGGTWHNLAVSLGAGLLNAVSLVAASNGTNKIMILPKESASGAGNSAPGIIVDSTPANVASVTVGQASTDQIKALHYDPVASLWIAAIYSTVTGVTSFKVSANDGATWTSPAGTVQAQGAGLSSLGRFWILTCEKDADSSYRVYVSKNQGASWTLLQARPLSLDSVTKPTNYASYASAFWYLNPKARVNSTQKQILLANGPGTRSSQILTGV